MAQEETWSTGRMMMALTTHPYSTGGTTMTTGGTMTTIPTTRASGMKRRYSRCPTTGQCPYPPAVAGPVAANQSEFAYSAIIARETEVRFDAFIDFVRNCRPDEKLLRNIVAGLLDLAAEEWRSPACRRQLRFEIEDQKAAYWIGRLGKENEQEKAVADALLARWGTADLIMVDIRSRRLRHGLDSVERERPRWYTAMRRKEIVEQEATHIDPAAHEYFLCRLEQYSIQREIAVSGGVKVDHAGGSTD